MTDLEGSSHARSCSFVTAAVGHPLRHPLWLTLQFSDLSFKVQIKESGVGLTFYFVLDFYKYNGFANVSVTVMPNAFVKNNTVFH